MKKSITGFLRNSICIISKCILAVFLMLIQLNLPENLLHAEGDFSDAPEVAVKFSYNSGGIKPTDREGNEIKNTILIGRADANSANIDLQMDPQFDSGSVSEPYFVLNLPYFYYDVNGVLITTFKKEEVPQDQCDDGESRMGLKAVVVDGKDFDVVNDTEFKGESDNVNTNVIKGSGVRVSSGTAANVSLKFYFYGDVPENATCIATVGGGYKDYVDGDITTEYNYRVNPGSSDSNKYTFICSNLRWETTIEAISKNVLWDKYNYMVYKVEIENTSDDSDSYFDNFDISLELPIFDTEANYGVRRKDMRKWLYNKDKDPILNDNIEEVGEKEFVGVPGDGGMLVYNVTGKSEEELKEWDLLDFHNVDEESIPYKISAQSGLVYLRSNEKIEKRQKRTYYMAVPVPRNFDPVTKPFVTNMYGTIFFGNGSYSWSKRKTSSAYFEAPKPAFAAEKYVLTEDDNKADTIEVAIGDDAVYYLDGFKNTGNLPAFDANATDTLPENFDLHKISISMPKDDKKEPKLEDWFAESDKIVELSFKKADGTKHYVAVSGLQEDTGASKDKETIWSIEVKDFISQYEKEHNETFAKTFRLNFKERIEPDEAFDGKIMVQGNLPVQSTYENHLTANYQERLYLQETADTEEGYERIDKKAEDKATIQTVPGNPLIETDVYVKNDDGSYTFSDPNAAPVFTTNVGFRYKLGNDSISSIIPGIFNTGDLLMKNDDTGAYGLITDSIIISKGLWEKAKVGELLLTYANGDKETVKADAFTTDDDGHHVYTLSSGKKLANAQIKFTSFSKETALSDDVYIFVNGAPNMIGEVKVEGSFATQYHDVNVDKEVKDEGILNVESIDMLLKAKSYHNDKFSEENTSIIPEDGDRIIHSLEVPNKNQNTGYRFELKNSSMASSGGAEAWIDFSNQVGNKNTDSDPVIKGFKTDTITISNLEKTGKIHEIRIYDYGQKKSDTAKLIIKEADLQKQDGNIIINKATLENAGIKRALYIVIDFDNYFGQKGEDKESMIVKVNGESDWYDDLDAIMTFIPDNPFMLGQIKDVTGRLTVKRPAMMLHTNLSYYENVPEKEEEFPEHIDGNKTYLAVPYDRDFKVRLTMENTEVSVLDNPHVSLQLPVNDKEQGEEAHTGFHATKVVINKALLEGYDKVEKLILHDVDGKKAELTYDNTTNTFTHGQTTYTPNTDGNIEITEAQLNALDITYLSNIEFIGYSYALNAKGWIDVYGFSDADFGTKSTVKAEATNYLDGIQKEEYAVKSNDDSVILTSKMYFDTVISAGYKDSENGERFDYTAGAREHIRILYKTTSNTSYFNDNSELDVGYKAIGSYMVDFRQYLNEGKGYPLDPNSPKYNNYNWQEPEDYNYVYTQAYNTAADVNMEVTLPSDKFETYYLKVDPRAKEYFSSIDVVYKDGKKETINSSEWQDNGIEKNKDSKEFFRINLMEGQKNYDSDETKYYRSPENYAAPDNPVEKVIIHLHINDKEAEDAEAKNPDYGTWYKANQQDTKYMFEVTGRFYKEGNANASVSANLKAGGELGNGASRTGVKAKVRISDEKDTEDFKSKWSYSNKYIYYYYNWGWESGTTEYDAQHLKSDVHVVVSHDDNKILKGVHKDPTKTEDRLVTYGEDYDYAVSFYREAFGTDHDYVSEKNSNEQVNPYWANQDLFDWKGKISFADQIILEDTLPAIHSDKTDANSEYYGFLTKNIRISKDLYQYVDHIEFMTKYEDDKGKPVSGQTGQTITLHKNDITGSYDSETDFYQILLKYTDRGDTKSNTWEILLNSQEYVKSYRIYLKNIPGSADFAREYNNTELKKADEHGDKNKVDIYVGGTVYLIDGIHPDKDAINNIKATTYKDNLDAANQPTEIRSFEDTGLLMGYRIPFQAGFEIDAIDSSNSLVKDHTMYDFKADASGLALEPNDAYFGVKVYNQKDGTSDDNKDKAAHIKTVTVTNAMNDNYRLKHIYIPSFLIDGAWFEISEMTLNYGNGKTLTLEKDELASSKYLKKDSGSGNYIFDANAFVNDHVDEFSTYTAKNTNKTYVKEYIQSFVFKLNAVNPDRTKPETVLDAGQYITENQEEGYAFTYDGIYVDRTEEDIKDNKWTEDARPTRMNSANHYHDSYYYYYYCYNTVDAAFTSSDLNAMPYGGNISSTKSSDYYEIANTVADLFVNLQRGKEIDGKPAFAYDRHEEDGTTKEKAVDKDHLTVNDYVEYELTLGVDKDSPIPSTHQDMRFTAPDGMRIVGWKVKENETGLDLSDITATAIQKSSTDSTSLTKDMLYSLTEDDNGEKVETNFKELNISIGEDTVLMAPGKYIRVTVITQLTNEIKPFEGKTITPVYEAAALPVHCYSQYRIYREKAKDNNNVTGFYSAYSTDGDINYYRGHGNYYRVPSSQWTEETYQSKITSTIKFMDADNLKLNYAFTDKILHFDKNPMKLSLTGVDVETNTEKDITNDSEHDLESLTYTVSFLSETNGILYKGFDLTKIPTFTYPDTMTVPTDKPIKIEFCYYDSSAEATAEGSYKKADVKDTWIDSQYVVLNEADVSDGKYLLADAVKIRWTYYDVPAWGSDGKEVTFATTKDPFILEGDGRYRDIRKDSEMTMKQYADRYKMEMSAEVTMVHKHNETITNTDYKGTSATPVSVSYEQEVNLGGNGKTDKNIARERPVVTLHTQIFDKQEAAEKVYDKDAEQKNGYRPNEDVWFKTTVKNKILTENTADSDMQGALLDPVIYDKIPEYITSSGLNNDTIHVKWYDKEGNEKNIPNYTITTKTVTAPDYGGDMVINHKEDDGAAIYETHAYQDIKMEDSGNTKATDIQYTVYKISFVEGTRLEVGERVEVWYDAKIRKEHLPLLLTQKDDNSAYMDYYPKTGEYSQSNSYYYPTSYPFFFKNPIIGTPDGGYAIKLDNQNVMMDMSYLQHDVGLSGTRNDNIDPYEYLQDATVYMPGSDDNNGDYGGANGYLKDMDMASASVQQATTYYPKLVNNALNTIPSADNVEYRIGNANRDYYKLLMRLRNKTKWDGEAADAIIWSQSRTHLQMSWLATSSQFISHEHYPANVENLANGKYVKGDSLQDYYPANDYYYGSSAGSQQTRYKYWNDDTITTLEYDQEFTTRLGAYNYGDWDISDGVTFTYVMPRGIEPKRNSDGNIDTSAIQAKILTGGDSKDPVMTAIEGVSVEVVQHPGEHTYLSPKRIQDPLLVQDFMNTTTAEYSKLKDYYSTSDTTTSWVLKITVNQPLKKWLNRKDEFGYQMLVDIPSHVYRTNESEYWYDEVNVIPNDSESDDNLYYQIYDMTASNKGNIKSLVPYGDKSFSTQFYGMDYLYNGYRNTSYYVNDEKTYYRNGAPNMPYINGMNISNKEVTLNGRNGTVVTNKLDSYRTGKRTTAASTGTRAKMRKPMIRTWTTVGKKPGSSDISDYYVMSEGESGNINIHLENKYYWPSQTVNGILTGVDGNNHSIFERNQHSYTVDGGNMGTLFEPVVNDLLPQGIVPKDKDGKLFTKDNEANAKKTLAWTLLDKEGNPDDGEKAKYTASVEYVPLTNEDGDVEGRYRVIFKQKGDEITRIQSEDTRIFQFSFFTKHKPDDKDKDGNVVTDLQRQYQKNHVYVSSQLENFKFLTDNDIPNNPFYVGAPYTPLRENVEVEDTRKDAIKATIEVPYGDQQLWTKEGGTLPAHIVTTSLASYGILDATKEKGIQRYKESDTFELEDYTDIRKGIPVSNTDWNTSGALTHQDGSDEAAYADEGVTTSARIRILKASISNESYVSTDKPVLENGTIKKLGTSGSEDGEEYHPDKDTHVQYGNSLYYTVKVENSADAADFENKGDILHAKMNVSLHLPKVATYMKNEGDAYYLIVKENDTWRKYEGKKAIEQAGYQVELVQSHTVDGGTSIYSFDILTKGTATTYDDFVDGKHTDGYFGSGDVLYFGIHTKVCHEEDPSTILTQESYWDHQYRASTYVTFHETDGAYLKEKYPAGNFDELDRQDLSLAKFAQKKVDEEPQKDEDYALDFDLDKIYGEPYTTDVTANVTVLKPHSIVRADTSVQRILFSNPDAEIQVAEDPTIKGATHMTVYIDESVNDGANVGEYLMDYRIPYRGTSKSTAEEAAISEKEVPSIVHRIRTGVWEVPASAGTEEYRHALQEKLKVHVYAKLCEEETTPAQANVSYEVPKDDWRNDGWIELTNQSGVALDENKVLTIDDNEGKRIYQLRFVICAEGGVETTRSYPVPQNFRLDIDANQNTHQKEEMHEVDPEHLNIEELPDSVKKNAAFVEVTTINSYDVRKHVNHFVSGWARYDDKQVGVISDRSRAGYFVTEEIPIIAVDLQGKYFKRSRYTDEQGDLQYKYQWNNDMLISPKLSTMVKYKAVYNNLSEDEAKANKLDFEVDNSSNPQISIVLPYLEEINDRQNEASADKYLHDNYRYVSYYDGEYEDSHLPDTFENNKALENAQAQWSWYVIDEHGDIVPKENVSLEDSKMSLYPKYTDLTNLQRKVVTWDFNGHLKPGQKLVVEFMVPLAAKDYGIVSAELLNCKAYAFKGGAFRIHIPSNVESNERWALEFDTRDINDNQISDGESALVKTLSGLAFESDRQIIRTKSSHSEYGSGLIASGNGEKVPSPVPEGSDYSFETAILNPDLESGSAGYKHPILYDVLPYEKDHTTRGKERNSKWRGFLDVDSLQVMKQYVKPASQGGGTAKEELENGKDYTLWIGPFTEKDGKIEKLAIEDLPVVEDTAKANWFESIYGTTAEAMSAKQKFMIPLRTLQEAKASLSADTYEDLTRNIQLIYVEPKEDFELNGGMKLQLSYRMHAPLNLPGYPGVISEGMSDLDITNAVVDYTGWNTFTTWAAEELETSLSPKAGVYLDAPSDRGYIGHYVWLDESYNAQFTDEGEYLKRDSDGRWIFKKATKDLDMDGQVDDPGINGVKVELLSEKGYPVNRDGEPVAPQIDAQGNKTGKYCVVDEDSGNCKLDTVGATVFTKYGPESYTTEKDAYGHNGYFIISNIKPGTYRLRYTFPKGSYDEYAVTTLELGNKEAGGSLSGVDVYRKGDTLPDLGDPGQGVVESDAQKAEQLIVQTKADTPIQIDAIGSDPSTYKNYDEKMTAYDLGIAHAYRYSGYAWIDQKKDDQGNIESNGLFDDEETPLKNVDIQFYRVDANGKRTKAIDCDGKNAFVTTDENGHFTVSLYPGYSYIGVATTENTNGVYKCSPINISTMPLQNQKDNDMYATETKENLTYEFAVQPKLDEHGSPQLTNGSYFYEDALGFGFVEAGRGYIGKNIFEDKNYNGILDTYLDETGKLVREPGCKDVKLIAEQYYYDQGEWHKVADFQKEEVSNDAGSYIFQNLTTTYTKDEKVYLAGYRIKVDMSTLPSGYTPTMYRINNGKNDSDLPVSGDADYRYLTAKDDYVILAKKAEQGDTKHIFEVDGKRYDASEGISVLDQDAGLASIDTAEIKGRIWEDKNYDGQQNTYTDRDGAEQPEPGISMVQLQLLPYVYDSAASKWVEMKDPDAAYKQSAVSDWNGEYVFTNVPSSVMQNGKRMLVSYKIQILTNIDDLDYAITLYHKGDAKTDSDLLAESHQLNKQDEYIIVGKRVADANDTATIQKLYGDDAKHFLMETKLGYYDINKVTNIHERDGGLVSFEKAAVSGRVWKDVNYDGLMQQDEEGIAHVNVELSQYIYDQTTTSWKKNEDFQAMKTTTNSNGEYTFDSLATHILLDKTYQLVGYKVRILNEDGTQPDRDIYAITKYRVADKEYRNSDLRTNYDMTANDEYLITAKPIAKEDDTQYPVVVGKQKYDLVAAQQQEHVDGGFSAYQTSTIQGNLFDDANYDGLYDEEEGFSEQLKEAFRKEAINSVTIHLAYYYKDGDTWKPIEEDGKAKVTTQEILLDGDGSYAFEDLPTVYMKGKTPYLAGYRLHFDQLPKGYRITKPLAANGVKDSSAQIKKDAMEITKTGSKGYLGKAKEELDGYIITADGVDKSTSSDMNLLDGYDCVKGRKLKDYNLGMSKQQSASIIGRIFHDRNYDGAYDEKQDVGINDMTMYLVQYYYDSAKNAWVVSDNNTESYERTDGSTRAYMRKSDTTQAVYLKQQKEDGIYQFNNLPTYLEKEGTTYVCAYRLFMENVPDGYMATYLHKKGVAEDQDSDLDLAQDTLLVDRQGSSYIIAAKESGKVKPQPSYLYEIEGKTYDIVTAQHTTALDAGITTSKFGSIEGLAFEDAVYDGIWKEQEDKLLSGMTICLKRSRYDSEQKKWIVDNGKDEDGKELDVYAKTTTDKDGHYRFDELPSYRKINGKTVLYGYTLWLETMPDKMGATKYQMCKDGRESALQAQNLQIIKQGRKLPEVKDGYLVVAHPLNDEEEANTQYIYEGYDIIRGEQLTNYNLGLKRMETGAINGRIWQDDNRDGIQNEKEPGLSGHEIKLEQYYLDAQKNWKPLAETKAAKASENESIRSVQSKADGTYAFTDLPAVGELNGKPVVYGYRLKLEELPVTYTVSAYQRNHGEKDSDLKETTGVLTHEEQEMHILAQKADEHIDKLYTVSGYNMLETKDVANLDAGLMTYESGVLGGIVFEDTNNNGIMDKKETPLAGVEVKLEYSVKEDSDGSEASAITLNEDIHEERSYLPYEGGTQKTAKDGSYAFKQLPIMDENGKPYQYRVRITLPDGMTFTKIHELQSNPQKHLNVCGHEKDGAASAGITQSLELGIRRLETNYYGHVFETQAKQYHHLDIGLKTKTKKTTRPFDFVNTAAALLPYSWMLIAVISLLIFLYGRRKRKEIE